MTKDEFLDKFYNCAETARWNFSKSKHNKKDLKISFEHPNMTKPGYYMVIKILHDCGTSRKCFIMKKMHRSESSYSKVFMNLVAAKLIKRVETGVYKLTDFGLSYYTLAESNFIYL